MLPIACLQHDLERVLLGCVRGQERLLVAFDVTRVVGAADEIRAGHLDIFDLERQAMARLAAHGWKPDYISIRKRADLTPPSAGDLAQGELLVVLTAAKLGVTRLIDNLEI